MPRASSRPTAPALALFAVYHFDVDYGGIGLGDGVPDLVLEHIGQARWLTDEQMLGRVAGPVVAPRRRRSGRVTDVA